MRELVMRVSPAVFSEMQEKALQFADVGLVYPGSNLFAEWANKTYGCEFWSSYQVVVMLEWNQQRRWDFSEV